MRIAMTKPLFAWDCLQDSPSLRTLREFLAAVPDEKLLSSLRSRRGRGRNDYPVHVLWGTLLLTIVLRHGSIESCLGELRRNESLRRLIGIESEELVPRKWNMSRFLKAMGSGPHLGLLREVFDTMVSRLGETVGDLGKACAGDATGLSARREHIAKKRTRKRSKKRKATRREPLGRTKGALPDPDGGRREYTDAEGNVTKVVEWFGYKLHLLVDNRHEVSLAYRVSSANRHDGEVLPDLVSEAQDNLPWGRIRTLAYDKAADEEGIHEILDSAGIVPVIENRTLWKAERERMLPGHDGRSNVVYDEAGTVYCYDKAGRKPVRHRMAYIGHEPARGTLKYRCPAMHQGWRCPSHRRCNGARRYGKTIRVKREVDIRRFPPIPRGTKKFERLYRGRTAVERVNARLKIFWGADDGNITGARRFHAYIGAVMVVHLGLATLLAATPRREGTLGRMRLGPIAKAIRKKLNL